jgi:hypothetical protein
MSSQGPRLLLALDFPVGGRLAPEFSNVAASSSSTATATAGAGSIISLESVLEFVDSLKVDYAFAPLGDSTPLPYGAKPVSQCGVATASGHHATRVGAGDALRHRASAFFPANEYETAKSLEELRCSKNWHESICGKVSLKSWASAASVELVNGPLPQDPAFPPEIFQFELSPSYHHTIVEELNLACYMGLTTVLLPSIPRMSCGKAPAAKAETDGSSLSSSMLQEQLRRLASDANQISELVHLTREKLNLWNDFTARARSGKSKKLTAEELGVAVAVEQAKCGGKSSLLQRARPETRPLHCHLYQLTGIAATILCHARKSAVPLRYWIPIPYLLQTEETLNVPPLNRRDSQSAKDQGTSTSSDGSWLSFHILRTLCNEVASRESDSPYSVTTGSGSSLLAKVHGMVQPVPQFWAPEVFGKGADGETRQKRFPETAAAGDSDSATVDDATTNVILKLPPGAEPSLNALLGEDVPIVVLDPFLFAENTASFTDGSSTPNSKRSSSSSSSSSNSSGSDVRDAAPGRGGAYALRCVELERLVTQWLKQRAGIAFPIAKPTMVCCDNAVNAGQAIVSLFHRFVEKPMTLHPLALASLSYEDTLQIPMQPLGDHLSSNVYETFEEDKVKYIRYSEAVELYLRDLVMHPEKSHAVQQLAKQLGRPLEASEIPNPLPVHITVLGAGRGPLVDGCLDAALNIDRRENRGAFRIAPKRSVRLILTVVEKNPSAVQYLHLRARHDPKWIDAATKGELRILCMDGREVGESEADEVVAAAAGGADRRSGLIDLVVSELLGSFGDNELSPECIDGFIESMNLGLTSKGVPLNPFLQSIPESYTAHAVPCMDQRVHHNVYTIGRSRGLMPLTAQTEKSPGAASETDSGKTALAPLLASSTFQVPHVCRLWRMVSPFAPASVAHLPATSAILSAKDADDCCFPNPHSQGTKMIWTFSHPTMRGVGSQREAPSYERESTVEFTAQGDGVVTGLAGYFSCVLYTPLPRPAPVEDPNSKNESLNDPSTVAKGPIPVTLSIVPGPEHTQAMFSWFPMYFPLPAKAHVVVGAGDAVEVTLARRTTMTKGGAPIEDTSATAPQKVWLEWSVVKREGSEASQPSGRYISNAKGCGSSILL